MANIDPIRRMHSTLDSYERGEITSMDVERTIPAYVDCLECLPYEKVDEVHALCSRLVAAPETDDMLEEFIDMERATTVLHDFRAFLGTLPGQP